MTEDLTQTEDSEKLQRTQEEQLQIDKAQAEIKRVEAETLKAESERAKIEFELDREKREASKFFMLRKSFLSNLLKAVAGFTFVGFYITYALLPISKVENYELKLENLQVLEKIQKTQERISKDSQLVITNLRIIDSLKVAITNLTEAYNNVLAAYRKDSAMFVTKASSFAVGFNRKMVEVEKAKAEVDRLQKKITVLPRQITIRVVDRNNETVRAYEAIMIDANGAIVQPLSKNHEYGFSTYILPIGGYELKINFGGVGNSQNHYINITSNSADTIFTYKADF